MSKRIGALRFPQLDEGCVYETRWPCGNELVSCTADGMIAGATELGLTLAIVWTRPMTDAELQRGRSCYDERHCERCGRRHVAGT